jgi:hypothetical protein
MTTRFSRVLQSDTDVTLTSDRIQEIADFIEKCPLIDGQLIEDVSLTSGFGGTNDNTVSHNLGRAYKGFIITNISSSSNVYESPTINREKKNSLILRCSSNATVSLWVF